MYIRINFNWYGASEEEISNLNEKIKCSIFNKNNFEKLYFICMLEFNKNKDKINEDKIKNDIIKFLKGGSVDGIEIDNTNEKYCSKDDLKIINEKFDYGDLSKLYLQWMENKEYEIKVNVNLINRLPIKIKYDNDDDNFLKALNEYLYKKRIRYQKRYLEDKKKDKPKKNKKEKSFDDRLADNMLHSESQMSDDELSIYKLALKKNINLYKCKDKVNKSINWTKATYMADPMILSNAYEKARMYLRRHGNYKKVKKFSPILEKQLNEIKNIIDSNKKIDSNYIDEIVKQLTQDKKIFNFHKEKMEEIKKYIKINIENFKEEIMNAKDKYKDKIIKKYRNIILIYLASARLDDKQKFFKLFVEKADNIKIEESDSEDEQVNNDDGHIKFKKKNKTNSEDNIRRINEELKRHEERLEKYQSLKDDQSTKKNEKRLNYLDDIAKGQKRGRQKAIYILLMSRLKYADGSPDLTIATPFGDVKMNLSSQELNSGCRLTTRQVSNALTEKLNPTYSKLINDICAILKTDDQKNQFFEILREYINFQCKPEKGNKCQLVKIIKDQLKNNKYGYEKIEELSMDIIDSDDLGELANKALEFTKKLKLDNKKLLIKLRGQMAEFCAISCLCEPLVIGSKFQDAVFKKNFKNNYEKYNDTVSWENSDFDNNNNKKENIKNEEKENEDEENEYEENEYEENEYEEKDDEEDNDYNKSNKNIKNKMLGKKRKKKHKNNSDNEENEDEENEYEDKDDEEKDDEEDNDYNKSNKNIKNKMLGKKSKKKYKNNSDNDSKNSSNNKNKKKKNQQN